MSSVSKYSKDFVATIGGLAVLCLVAGMVIVGLAHILRGPVQAEAHVGAGLPERQEEARERQVVAMIENATYVFLPKTGGCWLYVETSSGPDSVPKRSLDEVPCSLARHYLSDYSLQLLEKEEQKLGPIK